MLWQHDKAGQNVFLIMTHQNNYLFNAQKNQYTEN